MNVLPLLNEQVTRCPRVLARGAIRDVAQSWEVRIEPVVGTRLQSSALAW
jgi:hypothetical protein